jgi:hypothetical protein
MKSLLEIEQAIARLPKKSQRQLVRDIPVLCAEVFPTDGWEAILADATPRPGFASLLDKLDAEYKSSPEKFAAVNEDSLSERK